MQMQENIKYIIKDTDEELYKVENPKNTLSISHGNSSTFEERVKQFLSTNESGKDNNGKIDKPKLFILAPCYGGMCHVNFTTCLIQTIRLLEHFKIEYVVEFCKNDSLITRARNNLIAKAMSDECTTHMMFIDNDITWEPLDVIKLLISGKAIVGGVYPLKKYNWDKLVTDPHNPYNSNIIQSILQRKKSGKLNEIVSDVDYIRHNLLKYNINFLSSEMVIEENNLTKVRHLATGFMMIERRVIEKMMLAFPSTKYTDDVNYLEESQNKYAYTLFDTAVEDGHYLSEDWLFCERWRKMGGDVYIDVSIKLSHSGTENYDGFFLSTLL
jgi:hypothetical protein